MRKLFVYFLWTLLTITVLAVAGSFYAIDKGYIGYMPPIEDLQNPISRFATQIYSSDGKLLGTWNYNRENRVMVDYNKIAPSLIHALVATEDVRFYEHSGIDFIALGRAIVKRGVLGQKSAGGGSTITQQLAKQLYSEQAHSTIERLLQKPIEWVIAVKLERNYTKDEILTMYLNYFDFLHNAVGIKTASNTYFSKDPKDLTITESATLVGLCKNPSYFNPVRNPERSRDRRNVVLAQMVKAGYLTDAEYEKYSAEPLTLKFHVADHKEGLAQYFREYLRQYMTAKKPVRENYPLWNMAKFVNDSINWESDPLYGWCNKNKKRDGNYYNIYTDGLKVYTTIDSRMQEYAEKAAYQHVVKYLQPAFDKEIAHKTNAPYSSNLSKSQVEQILNRSIRQCERYRVLKESGASDSEIQKSFRTKTKMSVFTYHGEVDTTMTPLDSIKYYKSFLRTGFVSVCPQNGYVKAYVGGLNYEHFAYDMVMEGRRQVGSTIKPYLYSLAMENGFSPCDEAPNVQQTYVVAGQSWTPRNGSRARYGEMVTLKWGLQQSNIHTFMQVVDGLYAAVELEGFYLFARVTSRLLQLLNDICEGGESHFIRHISLNVNLLTRTFIFNEVADATPLVFSHLFHHVIAFRVYGTVVERVLGIGYAQETSTLLIGRRSQTGHFFQLCTRGKGTVLLTIVNDVLRQYGSQSADIGQQVL